MPNNGLNLCKEASTNYTGNFKAPSGWLLTFHMGHDVGYQTVAGESRNISHESADH